MQAIQIDVSNGAVQWAVVKETKFYALCEHCNVCFTLCWYNYKTPRTSSQRKINKNNIEEAHMQHAQTSTIRVYCRHAFHPLPQTMARPNCWFAWLLIIIFVDVLVLLLKTMLSTFLLTNTAHYRHLFPKMQFVIKLFTLHTSINLYGLFIVDNTGCVLRYQCLFIDVESQKENRKLCDQVGKIKKNNTDDDDEKEVSNKMKTTKNSEREREREMGFWRSVSYPKIIQGMCCTCCQE